MTSKQIHTIGYTLLIIGILPVIAGIIFMFYTFLIPMCIFSSMIFVIITISISLSLLDVPDDNDDKNDDTNK